MTTTNGQVADVVEGIVESVNDRGIRVQGEWRNVSKFHPVDLPDRGARVRVSLDPKGFIRSIEILDQAPPPLDPVRQGAIARSAACARSRSRPTSSASSLSAAKR